MERFVAYLIEEYKGAFPTWLAPTQVKLIPVNVEAHGNRIEEIYHDLRSKGFRVEMDLRNEKLGYKIREAQTSKIPYQLVIGDQEVEDGTVNVRQYSSKDQLSMSYEEFVQFLSEDVTSKSRINQ